MESMIIKMLSPMRKLLKECGSVRLFLIILVTMVDGTTKSIVATTLSRDFHFRAGVVEITPVWSAYRGTSLGEARAKQEMQKSLDNYDSSINKAMRIHNDIQILVFPQHGIHGIHTTKSTLKYFLHNIDPDPEIERWEPCESAKEKKPWSALWRLSCLAKKNKLYIVANIAEKENCNRTLDSSCPAIGYYIYSTTICFDSYGRLVARHRACHLSHLDRVIYDQQQPCAYFPVSTHFGTLGLATGYDLMYRDPVIILSEQFRTDHLAVPVAWRDKLPFDTPTGFHQAFARSRGVNVFAANLNIQVESIQGSGIYSPKGAQTISRKGKLGDKENILLAKVHKKPRAQRRNGYELLPPRLGFFGTQNNDSHSIQISRNVIAAAKKLDLTNMSHNISVCHERLCCYFSYSISHVSSGELFVAGAYNGVFSSATSFQAEMCFLIKCLSSDIKSCGKSVTNSDTIFKNIVIHGNFSTHYLYGHIFSNGGTLLIDNWQASYMTLWTNKTLALPLLSAVLTGRPYHLDDRIINEYELSQSILYGNGAHKCTQYVVFKYINCAIILSFIYKYNHYLLSSTILL